MISRKQLWALILTLGDLGPKRDRAMLVVSSLAGERLKENQSHRNNLIFMAREAMSVHGGA